MALDLRPLTLGELLDRSFSIFRHHFWMFVGIMAVPSVMALALSVLSLLMIAVIPAADTAGSGTTEQTPGEAVRTLIWVGTLGLAIVATLIVYFITYAVALGATTIAVSQIYLDRPGSIGSAYSPLKGKVGRLTLLFLLVSLRIFGLAFIGLFALALSAAVLSMFSQIVGVTILLMGMLAVGALCIWLVLRYAVSVPVAVLEDESATGAIGRSVQLTEGNRGRVFVLVMFSAIIAYAALFIFQGPFFAIGLMAQPGTPMQFWTNLLSSVFGAIGSALTAPLMVVAFAVLYYDLRVRKEGLDLDVMLAKLPAGTSS